MPICSNDKVTFGRVGRRVVEAAFDGGDIASDGGAMLLRQRPLQSAGAASPGKVGVRYIISLPKNVALIRCNTSSWRLHAYCPPRSPLQRGG